MLVLALSNLISPNLAKSQSATPPSGQQTPTSESAVPVPQQGVSSPGPTSIPGQSNSASPSAPTATPAPVQPQGTSSTPIPAQAESVPTPTPVQKGPATVPGTPAQPTQGATPPVPSSQPGTLPTPQSPDPASTVAPSIVPGQPMRASPSVTPSTQKSPSSPRTRSTGMRRTRGITIPEASAITVTFCSTVRFDSKQKSGFPAVVYLARPIMDSNGNVLAPVNSMVNVQLKPKGKEIKITADALVVGGRFIPIKSSQLSVPILSKTDQQTNYYSYGQDNQGVIYNVANGLQDWLNDQGVLSDGFSDVLGVGLTIASGFSRGRNRPKITEVMEVSEGSTLIFPLLATVALPSLPVQALSRPTSQAPAVCSGSGAGYRNSSYGSSGYGTSNYGSSEPD